MPNELKPCPFCGGGISMSFGINKYQVHCINCHATIWGKDTADAIAAWNRRTPDHIPDARKMIDTEMLHALKNAWATLSYMPCMCGYGFICGRCNTFNEIDALLKRVCGDDWYDREFEQYCKENPET